MGDKAVLSRRFFEGGECSDEAGSNNNVPASLTITDRGETSCAWLEAEVEEETAVSTMRLVRSSADKNDVVMTAALD